MFLVVTKSFNIFTEIVRVFINCFVFHSKDVWCGQISCVLINMHLTYMFINHIKFVILIACFLTPRKNLTSFDSLNFTQILGNGMDTQDTSPSVLLFSDKWRFLFNAGEVSVFQVPFCK